MTAAVYREASSKEWSFEKSWLLRMYTTANDCADGACMSVRSLRNAYNLQDENIFTKRNQM